MELREADLRVFRRLLDTAAGPTATARIEQETRELVEAEITRTTPRYRRLDARGRAFISRRRTRLRCGRKPLPVLSR
jgi:hypothetical protein